jgi:hypothetical protein
VRVDVEVVKGLRSWAMEHYESRDAALRFLSALTLFQRIAGISLGLFGFSTRMRSPVTTKTLASNP